MDDDEWYKKYPYIRFSILVTWCNFNLLENNFYFILCACD